MLGMICSELHCHWGPFSHLFYIKITSCLGVHRCVMVQVKSKLKIAFIAGRLWQGLLQKSTGHRLSPKKQCLHTDQL